MTAELIFNEANKAKQIVAWNTMVSQDLLKEKILTLIKEKHNCLLTYDLVSMFNEILGILGDEEAQIEQNLLTFKKEKNNVR